MSLPRIAPRPAWGLTIQSIFFMCIRLLSMSMRLAGKKSADLVGVAGRVIHRQTLDQQRLRVQNVRIVGKGIRTFGLESAQLLEDRVICVQFEYAISADSLTAVDGSLLVEHLLHFKRYRAFGAQTARMVFEAAGQLDLLHLALKRLA